MLDQSRSVLLATYESVGRELAPEEIEERRDAFLAEYSPESLSTLSGEDLMRRVHGNGPRTGLFYDLEFADRYAPFGSIGGGSALKFKVYKAGDGSGYRKKGQNNVPIPCSDAEAARMTAEIVSLLCKALQAADTYHLADGDIESWRNFERDVTSELPPSLAQVGHDSSVALLGWAHKYLAICRPDLFSFHHQSYQLANHLVRLGEVPVAGDSRYLLDFQWRQLRLGDAELKACHPVLLMLAAYRVFGAETRFWRIGTDEHHEQGLIDRWPSMEAGGFASIGWASLGNLRDLLAGLEGTQARERIKEAFGVEEDYSDRTPRTFSKWAAQIYDFYVGMSVGDRIVAMKGKELLGVGEVAGEYEYDSYDVQPHHRKVCWHDVPSETWPDTPGLQITLYNFTRRYAEAVRTETLLLSTDVLKSSPPLTTPLPTSSAPTVVKEPGDNEYLATPITLAEIVPLAPLEQRIAEILERKGQVILYGPPGTGKTYQARQTARELMAREMCGGRAWDMLHAAERQVVDSAIRFITLHPAYAYEDFIEGYRPVRLDNGDAGFELRNGVFLDICDDARQHPGRHCILLMDEINRGNVAAVMGELITLLEADKRENLAVVLPLSRRAFRIPKNVWIIGTMNTADRSISLLDAALRRRFGFVEMLPEPERISVDIDGLSLSELLTEINARIRKHITRNARELQVGHAYFMRGSQPLKTKEDLLAAFRDDILPLLAEYCFENYTMLASILGHEIIDVSAQIPNETVLSDAARLHQALRRLTPASPTPPGNAEAMEEHNQRPKTRSAAAADSDFGDEADHAR